MPVSRVTISLDESLLIMLEAYMRARGYANRSEVIRDLVRSAMAGEEPAPAADTPAVGIVSYLYDHHDVDVPQRLNRLQHHYHDMAVCTTHVHIDHDTCLESVVVRGDLHRVQRLAAEILSVKGIHEGRSAVLPL